MEHIIVTPRATEKAYAQVTATNTYVFDVPLTANKQQIAAAVAHPHGIPEVYSGIPCG